MTMMRNWPTGSARRDRGQPDRDVRPEDAAPADRPDQDAAQHRAERHGQAEHAIPHADGAGAFGRAGEGVGDDAERRGVEHRAAGTLQDPEADQPAQARRQAAQPGAEGEQRESDLKMVRRPIRSATAPENISSAASAIVLSRPTMNRLMQQTASIRPRRPRPAAGRDTGAAG